MQSDDTIDSFFASSDPKFDNLKDESLDVNVSVCSLISRADFAGRSPLIAEECDKISNSSASFFTAFRPTTKLDKNAKNEQNLHLSLELLPPSMVDKTFNKNGNSVKILYLVYI